MITIDELEAVGDAVAEAANSLLKHENEKWHIYVEFLEAYADSKGTPHDCQYIVNAEMKAGKTFRKSSDKSKALDVSYKVALAICKAFNSLMSKEEMEDGSWYVHSETNYWDKDGEEVDDIESANTIQHCIFQYYE